MNIIRLFFSKRGEAAYISHLDLQRVMARALRISGMPVWYSQGFNPHIYMSFALPLPLGQQSLCESVDCKTEATAEECAAFTEKLDAALPRGIQVTGVAAPKHKADEIDTAAYEVLCPGADVAALAGWYNSQPNAMVVRKTKRSETPLDLKTALPALKEDPGLGGVGGFAFSLPAGGEKHLNPALFTSFLEQGGLEAGTAEVVRKAIFVADGKAFE